jgi:hypothetical protein
VPIDRSFQARNTASRKRLETLVGRLTDDDLARRLPDGWTVAASLVHLAFWDLRAATLIGRLKAGHSGGPSPMDTDVANDTLLALMPAIAPRAAARLAVEAARAADEGVEWMSEPLLAEAPSWRSFSLARHEHREEHLDAIDRALA